MVREAVDKVIVEGAGIERTLLEIQEDKIASTTEHRNDDTLPEGETKIIQVGEEGLLRKTIKKQYFNDELRSTTVVESSLIKEATPTIILVGTKHVPTIKVEQNTQIENIAYKTQKIEDPDLAKGETKVVQVGQNGIIEKVYQLTYTDGVLTKTDLISSKEVQQVQDEIIHIGTQVTETKEISTTSPIPYNVIIRKDKTKPVGYSLVEVEGKEGTQTDYYQITYVNGKETKREHLRTVNTTQPVDKVVVEGSGIEHIVFEIQEERITSPIEYRNDGTLPEGETKLVQEGQDGLIHKTIQKEFFNDEERSSKLVESKVVREPVPTIILVGTKRIPTITTEESLQVEEVAFEKQIVENAALAKGTTRLLQKGQAGKRQDVYRLTLEDGVIIKKELVRSEVLEKPQAEITEIGTKRIPTITTEEIFQVEEVAFEKQTVENAALAKGTTRLLQKGNPSKRQDVYRLTLEDGVVIKKELIRSEILEEAQAEIVEIGTLVQKPQVQPPKGQPLVRKSEFKPGQRPSTPADKTTPMIPSSKQLVENPLVVTTQKPQKTAFQGNQDKVLPETGAQSPWWLSLLGSLLLFLTFVGLIDKKDDY